MRILECGPLFGCQTEGKEKPHRHMVIGGAFAKPLVLDLSLAGELLVLGDNRRRLRRVQDGRG